MKTPTKRMAVYAQRHGNLIGAPSAHRDVFKCRTSKFVFKVEKSYISSKPNVSEYQTYQQLQKMEMPEGVRLVKMFMLENGTLACEFVKGEHPAYTGCNSYSHGKNCKGSDCWLRKVGSLKLKDIHYQNVLIERDGTVVLIDIDGGFGDYVPAEFKA